MKDVVSQYIKDFEANICKIPETFQKDTHCSVSNKLSKIVTSLNSIGSDNIEEFEVNWTVFETQSSYKNS